MLINSKPNSYGNSLSTITIFVFAVRRWSKYLITMEEPFFLGFVRSPNIVKLCDYEY